VLSVSLAEIRMTCHLPSFWKKESVKSDSLRRNSSTFVVTKRHYDMKRSNLSNPFPRESPAGCTVRGHRDLSWVNDHYTVRISEAVSTDQGQKDRLVGARVPVTSENRYNTAVSELYLKVCFNIDRCVECPTEIQGNCFMGDVWTQ
jgi:hypothetical protein